MKCVDCPHFRIRSYPLKAGGECWDTGLAECIKHNIAVDFVTWRQLDRLECVEEDGESDG